MTTQTIKGEYAVDMTQEWGLDADEAIELALATGQTEYLAGYINLDGQKYPILMSVNIDHEGGSYAEIRDDLTHLTYLGKEGYSYDDTRINFYQDLMDQSYTELLQKVLGERVDWARIEAHEPKVGYAVGDSHLFTRMTLESVQAAVNAYVLASDAMAEWVGDFERTWESELYEAHPADGDPAKHIALKKRIASLALEYNLDEGKVAKALGL